MRGENVEVTRGSGVDGVRRPRNARQIRARGSNLDDSAGVLSARQANLLEGVIAEARARGCHEGNSAVSTGGEGSARDAVDIELHALSRDPAGAERPEGGSRILVDHLVRYTHESLACTHCRSFRATSVPRR